MDKDLIADVVETARRVVASGAISANGHGNVSLRVPGADEMYFTAAPSLRDHPASAIVRVALDGTLLEGELPPIQGAVVAMHTAMYADHPDVACVVHTHSPYATAYAVAGRPIGCWVEAMAMFGLPSGVPVAAYGPGDRTRPSPTSARRSGPACRPCCWRTTACSCSIDRPTWPSWSAGVIEEAAQAGINAASIGGAREVPAELREAALQRAMAFEREGTARV